MEPLTTCASSILTSLDFDSRVAFMDQEQKLRIADAHTIAVLEHAALDRHVVNKRAVKTLEIRDDETVSLFSILE